MKVVLVVLIINPDTELVINTLKSDRGLYILMNAIGPYLNSFPDKLSEFEFSNRIYEPIHYHDHEQEPGVVNTEH